jgi:fusion and transport protein UGO1
MANHREGVNPLRPYYIPPTIGPPADAVPKSSPSPNPFSHGGHHATASGRYATKARDAFADLEYKDYLGDASPSVVQNVKDLVEELMWKYTSVLMAQPFEVAKTILQVRDQDENAALATHSELEAVRKRTSTYGSTIYDVRYATQRFACPLY